MKKTIFILAAAAAMAVALTSCNGNGNDASNNVSMSETDVVLNNIMSRKSVRKFSSDTVPADVVDAILKAGMAAPTAMNRQPWAIGVVNDKALLQKMSEKLPYSRLETAPVAFVICGDMTKTPEGESRDFWVVDCSLMAENMLLAAHAYGLGAVFTGAWPTKERGEIVAESLNIPENYVVLGVIPMGYPAENPDAKDKWNPDAVHYNVW